jgi:nitrate reductase gamma subunit
VALRPVRLDQPLHPTAGERLLKWGSPVFHYGTFAAIGGHVIGVLIPEAWTHAVGIPENAHLGHGYDYRTTVAPWFRGLFSGSPDASVMASAPVIYQVHVTAAWVIWAVWPFSRLVAALRRLPPPPRGPRH